MQTNDILSFYIPYNAMATSIWCVQNRDNDCVKQLVFETQHDGFSLIDFMQNISCTIGFATLGSNCIEYLHQRTCFSVQELTKSQSY